MLLTEASRRLDADLIADVQSLQQVYQAQGLQLFHYACIDARQPHPPGRPTSPLFHCCTPDGADGHRPDGRLCGDLIEIKYPQYPTGPRVAWTDEWTVAIREDDRVPWTLGRLLPENLWAFAEWQQVFRDYFRAAKSPC
jgi:hypothetical protein